MYRTQTGERTRIPSEIRMVPKDTSIDKGRGQVEHEKKSDDGRGLMGEIKKIAGQNAVATLLLLPTLADTDKLNSLPLLLLPGWGKAFFATLPLFPLSSFSQPAHGGYVVVVPRADSTPMEPVFPARPCPYCPNKKPSCSSVIVVTSVTSPGLADLSIDLLLVLVGSDFPLLHCHFSASSGDTAVEE